MSRGVLFVMSGPSGTGKGTICERLISNENNNIFLSISTTTREIRKGETDGVTYNYTTVENFEKLIADGEMLEYAQFNGNYYGTPKKAVSDMLSAGKNVLLEIEVQGALKVKNIFPDAILMFLIPPSMAELKKRLTERGRETEEQIAERMETAKWEFTKSVLYNRIFINDDLDTCVNEVETVIRGERAKRDLVDKLISEQY